jgi:hypothetical protein
MKIRLFNIILFCYCCTLAPSCNHSHHSEQLQEGDLLFQNLNCGDLCNAIEAVTEGVNGKDFSHCAMVVNVNDTLKVIEAIGYKVQVNSLKKFFARSGDTTVIQNITVGRVKHQFENLIPNAISNAKQLIGQTYDDEFLLGNGKWYCSELIYETFKQANNQNDFFELEPMTFIDPKTKTFFPTWVNYYKELKTEIPEGKLGINPGLISRSNKIQIIKINSFNDINSN